MAEPERDQVEGLARAGLAAKGILYAVLGLLALAIARGDSAQDADQEGALCAVAAQPFGGVLVAAMALGLLGYALWRLAQALWPRFAKSDALWRRAVNAVRGLLYTGLAGLAAIVVLGVRTDPDSETQITATVLSWPWGVAVVVLVGLVIVGVGLYQGYQVVSGGLREQIIGDRQPARAWLVPLGSVGFLARMAAFTLSGGFVVSAALAFDPERSRGLDGALQEVASTSAGRWAIGGLALGLLAYGVFCLALVRLGSYRDA
jgi:hypothetical protein